MSVSAVLVVLVEHVAADDHAADLTGTFADGEEFGIAVEALDFVLVAEAVAAHDLDTLVTDADTHLGREHLEHSCLCAEFHTGIAHAGDLVHHAAGDFNLGLHFCQFVVDSLVFADGSAEGHTLLSVFGGALEDALGHTDSYCRDGNTAVVDAFHEERESFVDFADDVFLGFPWERGHL